MLVYLLMDYKFDDLPTTDDDLDNREGETAITYFETDESRNSHLSIECREAYCKKLTNALKRQKPILLSDIKVGFNWSNVTCKKLIITLHGDLFEDLRRWCGDHIHFTVEGSIKQDYQDPDQANIIIFEMKFKTEEMKWYEDASNNTKFYSGDIIKFPPEFEDFWTTQEDQASEMEVSIYFSVDDDIVTQDQHVLNKVTNDNGKILSRQLHSDVSIVASNNAEIPAHKCFLSVASSVLETMLGGDFKEARLNCVEMKDVSQQCLEAFLEYLYTSKISKARNDPELAVELLKVAHKYDVQPLQTLMKSILLQRTNHWFSIDQAVDLFRFARNVENLAELKLKAVQVLKLRSDKFLTSDAYNEVFEDDKAVGKDLVSVLLEHLNTAN